MYRMKHISDSTCILYKYTIILKIIGYNKWYMHIEKHTKTFKSHDKYMITIVWIQNKMKCIKGFQHKNL